MIRKAALFSFTLMLALGSAEGVLHLWPTSMRAWFPEGMYQNDPDPGIAYRLSPSVREDISTPAFQFTVTTNSRGFRGPELTRDSNLPVVGLFGDSYTFGQGVDDDDTFAAMSGRQLESVQVINAGVYGYRPSQAYRTYQRLTRERPLDTVVLQICYNDIEDQAMPIVRAVYRGHLNPNPPTDAWGEVKNELLLYSEIAARLRLVYFGVQAASLPRPDWLDPDFDTRRAREIATTVKILADWIEEANRRQQRMIVLYIPHEWQVDLSAAARAASWRAESGGVDQDAAHRWLRTFLEPFPQVTFIDFASIFRDHYAGRRGRLYLPNDPHLNERGNEIVAERLVAALRASAR